MLRNPIIFQPSFSASYFYPNIQQHGRTVCYSQCTVHLLHVSSHAWFTHVHTSCYFNRDLVSGSVSLPTPAVLEVVKRVGVEVNSEVMAEENNDVSFLTFFHFVFS